jgi:hypothetical protein
MKHMLIEADSTTEVDTSKWVYLEDVVSNTSNTLFIRKNNLKCNRESNIMCTIHKLQILCMVWDCTIYNYTIYIYIYIIILYVLWNYSYIIRNF